MTYWDDRPASKSNLCLLEDPQTWRRFDNKRDEHNNSIVEEGAGERIESALINALNSTNLCLLTGAGSSYCADSSHSNNRPSQDAPSLNDLWAAVENEIGTDRFNEILQSIPGYDAIQDIEKLLTQCKLYVALFGADDKTSGLIAQFISEAENAILRRVDFVDHDTRLDAHEAIIRKMARRGARKPRAKIFTTNYDLCFEYAARRQRFVVIDGFSHAAPPIYDRSHFSLDIVRRERNEQGPEYYENVFHLHKLHGSIDWRRKGGEIIKSREPSGQPVLIYPRDSKYQEAFEPPYLDMMAAFQRALREPDTALIVSGFSFTDTHISQPILAALESNMSFRLVVCAPGFILPESLESDEQTLPADLSTDNEPFGSLLRLARAGDPRIILLNGRFEDLADALPDLVAETEREQHMRRVQTLRRPDVADEGAQDE